MPSNLRLLGMAGLLQSKVKGDYSKVAAWVLKKSLQKEKSDQVNYMRHNLITFCCKNPNKQIKNSSRIKCLILGLKHYAMENDQYWWIRKFLIVFNAILLIH